MYKNLKNGFKYPSPADKSATSPSGGEVSKNAIFKVILERERSELPRASRNFMAILSKETKSLASRFLNVINGRDAQSVPLILVQQVIYLVNKFAVLLHKYRFRQDCRNRLCVMSGNDCKRQKLSICCQFFKRMYHTGHSANSLCSKPSVTGNCVGRSMIEMLGVLAIIAVLTVGGIAGYSKAMSAYKLNKWTSQIREMIANTQTLYMNQKAYSYNAVNLMNTLIAAEAIPQGMLDENNSDAYGNILSVYITSKKSVVAGERIKFQWRLPQTKSSIDCCAKLYELGQYYYNSLWLVAIEADFTYTICGNMSPEAWLNDQKCQPYDFIKAKQHCKKCETQNCTMLFIMDDSAF